MTKKENLNEGQEQQEKSVNTEQVNTESTAISVPQTEEAGKSEELEKKTSKSKKKAYVSPELEITAETEQLTEEIPPESSEKEALEHETELAPILTEQDSKEKKRSKKRQVRSKNGPPVMSIDFRRTVETDADRAKSDLIDLMESVKSDKILTGKIQGVEQDFQGHKSVAVLYHGVFKVVIPAEELVEKPNPIEGKTLEESYHYFATRRLGAEIDYVVDRVYYDEMLAFASRLDAMRVKRKRFYRGGVGALVHEGVRAEARVVTVISSGIVVDVFGVECFIPSRELSYQRIGNAMSLFTTGDRIIVKILSVDNKDLNNIKLEASVKQATVNPYESALRKYSIGNRYVGTVSMVDKHGVFVALDGGVDCLCRFPARGRPMKGARVTVQILGIDEKSNRIWGIITHASMAF